MAGKKNRNSWVVPVFIIAVLIPCIYLLNRSLPVKPSDDDAAATQDKPRPKDNAAARVLGEAAKRASDPSSVAPSNFDINDPQKATTKIVIGWIYDPANQAKPEDLIKLLIKTQAVAFSSGGSIAVTAADLDLPSQQLTPRERSIPGVGIWVNGKQSFKLSGKSVNLSGNLGSGQLNSATLDPVLTALLKDK